MIVVVGVLGQTLRNSFLLFEFHYKQLFLYEPVWFSFNSKAVIWNKSTQNPRGHKDSTSSMEGGEYSKLVVHRPKQLFHLNEANLNEWRWIQSSTSHSKNYTMTNRLNVTPHPSTYISSSQTCNEDTHCPNPENYFCCLYNWRHVLTIGTKTKLTKIPPNNCMFSTSHGSWPIHQE